MNEITENMNTYKKLNITTNKFETVAGSDLLSEAIADAKAVRAPALANAKSALEEAFATELSEKLKEEEKQGENLFEDTKKSLDCAFDEVKNDDIKPSTKSSIKFKFTIPVEIKHVLDNLFYSNHNGIALRFMKLSGRLKKDTVVLRYKKPTYITDDAWTQLNTPPTLINRFSGKFKGVSYIKIG